MKSFENLLIYVTNKCQNKCEGCIYTNIRAADPTWELFPEELDTFIDVVKQSEYHFEQITIKGAGEPLLWKNFSYGINKLIQSNICDSVLIYTNGLLLGEVDEEIINHPKVSFYVSVYPGQHTPEDISQFFSNEKTNSVRKLTKTDYDGNTEMVFGNHIVRIVKKFIEFDRDPRNVYDIPCECHCGYPLFYKDKVYLYCGGFQLESKIEVKTPLVSDLKVGFLDSLRDAPIRHFEECRRCLGNKNRTMTLQDHRFKE